MSDARWVYAPIGGGKSLFCVMEFFKELRRSDRHCVTSLPLILDPNCKPDKRYQTVQEWADKWVERPVDVFRRVFILTMEQQREFWRYLPADMVTQEQIDKYRLEVVQNPIEGLGYCLGIKLPNRPHPLYKEVCDFSFRTDKDNARYFRRGCFYQLDECHKSFPARYWQALGPQVEDYVSELRKLNDDVDFITQHPEKVDKNLRRNATEWTQCVNLARTRLFMGVTLKKKFRSHNYQQTDMPTRSDKPTSSEFYSLGTKERPEWTYLTLWGQSVRGGPGVETNRRLGRHPLVWVVAIAVLFVFCKFAPGMVEGAIRTGIQGFIGGVGRGIQKGVTNMVPQVAGTSVAPPVVSHETAQPEPRPQAVSFSTPRSVHGLGRVAPNIQCVGVWCVDSNDVRVFLSDGRVAYANRGEVQGIGSRFVKVFNEEPIPRKD